MGAAFTVIIVIYIMVAMMLIEGGFGAKNNKRRNRKGDQVKTKRDNRGASTEGQIHETKVNVEKGLDVRPRKNRGTVRSKKVVPWRE